MKNCQIIRNLIFPIWGNWTARAREKEIECAFIEVSIIYFERNTYLHFAV